MSTTLEANRDLVRRYFHALNTEGLGRALQYLTQDATWWVPGNWELSGSYTRAQLEAAIDQLPYDGFPQAEVASMIAEGDRVSAEVRMRGRLKDGRTFDFWIHFLFVIAGDKIRSVKEYVDSQYTRQLFFGAK